MISPFVQYKPDSAELARLSEDFRNFDANHDGRLAYPEFVSFLKSLESGMSDQEMHIGFAEVDTDHDGGIELGEFLEWWGSP